MEKSGRVEFIDGLRGLAALAVVLYHYIGYIPRLEIPMSRAGAAVVGVTRFGYLGVPVFFVLSGYVIAMTAARHRFGLKTGSRFVLRRFVRLAPPYWAVVLAIALTLAAAHRVGYFRSITLDVRQITAHIFYSQEIFKYRPLDLAFWTLCLEVQFYLVFTISKTALIRFSPSVESAWFFALTAVSVGLRVFSSPSNVWFGGLWYEFGMGVLAYRAVQDRTAVARITAFVPIVVAIFAGRHPVDDVTTAATVAVLIVGAETSLSLGSSLPWLLRLGAISYSLYLVHGLIGLFLGVALRPSMVRSELLVWIVIAIWVLMAVALAAGFYYFVERRAMEWSRLVSIEGGKRKAGQVAGAHGG